MGRGKASLQGLPRPLLCPQEKGRAKASHALGRAAYDPPFAHGCTEAPVPMPDEQDPAAEAEEFHTVQRASLTMDHTPLHQSHSGRPTSYRITPARAGNQVPVVRNLKSCFLTSINLSSHTRKKPLLRISYTLFHGSPKYRTRLARQRTKSKLKSLLHCRSQSSKVKQTLLPAAMRTCTDGSILVVCKV